VHRLCQQRTHVIFCELALEFLFQAVLERAFCGGIYRRALLVNPWTHNDTYLLYIMGFTTKRGIRKY
jgi:hypothetical protein